MDDEIILRKQVVELHLNGLSKTEISDKLGRSRQWVHKWLKRYVDIGGSQWFIPQSNAPNKIVSKTPDGIEQLIVHIRKALGGKRYAQKGALSIIYELDRLGVVPPSLSTINRILKRHNLIGESKRQLVKKRITLTILRLSNKWTWLGPSTLPAAFGSTS